MMPLIPSAMPKKWKRLEVVAAFAFCYPSPPTSRHAMHHLARFHRQSNSSSGIIRGWKDLCPARENLIHSAVWPFASFTRKQARRDVETSVAGLRKEMRNLRPDLENSVAESDRMLDSEDDLLKADYEPYSPDIHLQYVRMVETMFGFNFEDHALVWQALQFDTGVRSDEKFNGWMAFKGNDALYHAVSSMISDSDYLSDAYHKPVHLLTNRHLYLLGCKIGLHKIIFLTKNSTTKPLYLVKSPSDAAVGSTMEAIFYVITRQGGIKALKDVFKSIDFAQLTYWGNDIKKEILRMSLETGTSGDGPSVAVKSTPGKESIGTSQSWLDSREPNEDSANGAVEHDERVRILNHTSSILNVPTDLVYEKRPARKSRPLESVVDSLKQGWVSFRQSDSSLPSSKLSNSQHTRSTKHNKALSQMNMSLLPLGAINVRHPENPAQEPGSSDLQIHSPPSEIIHIQHSEPIENHDSAQFSEAFDIETSQRKKLGIRSAEKKRDYMISGGSPRYLEYYSLWTEILRKCQDVEKRLAAIRKRTTNKYSKKENGWSRRRTRSNIKKPENTQESSQISATEGISAKDYKKRRNIEQKLGSRNYSIFTTRVKEYVKYLRGGCADLSYPYEFVEFAINKTILRKESPRKTGLEMSGIAREHDWERLAGNFKILLMNCPNTALGFELAYQLCRRHLELSLDKRSESYVHMELGVLCKLLFYARFWARKWEYSKTRKSGQEEA